MIILILVTASLIMLPISAKKLNIAIDNFNDRKRGATGSLLLYYSCTLACGQFLAMMAVSTLINLV